MEPDFDYRRAEKAYEVFGFHFDLSNYDYKYAKKAINSITSDLSKYKIKKEGSGYEIYLKTKDGWEQLFIEDKHDPGGCISYLIGWGVPIEMESPSETND